MSHAVVTELKPRLLASREVHIITDDGQVDQDPVTISAGTDQVTWTAHGAKKAIVVFASPDGSPFHDALFQVPAGGSVSSGPVKSTAAYQSYKYTVVGQVGVKDPVVIVQN